MKYLFLRKTSVLWSVHPAQGDRCQAFIWNTFRSDGLFDGVYEDEFGGSSFIFKGGANITRTAFRRQSTHQEFQTDLGLAFRTSCIQDLPIRQAAQSASVTWTNGTCSHCSSSRAPTKGTSLYTLRHTSASLMVMNGEHPEQLGTSIQMLVSKPVNTYARIINDISDVCSNLPQANKLA